MGAATSLMIITVMPAFALGTLAPFIIDDLDSVTGTVGQAFGLFYLMSGLASPVLGRLVDGNLELPLDRILLGGAALCAVVLATAMSRWSLYAGAVVGGLCYGGANPLTNASLSSIGRRLRGLGLGAKQAGVPAASALTGLLVPAVAVTLGWREAFALIALAAVAGGVALRVPAARAPVVVAADQHADRSRQALAYRQLVSYAFFLSLVTSCFHTYLLLYIVRSDILVVALAGSLVALAGLVGMASRVASASWTDRRTNAAIFRSLMVFALGGATACALLALGSDEPVLWLLAVLLYGVCLFGWGGALAVALVRVAPGRTGRATGTVYAGFYAGLSLGPVAFGSFLLPRWGYSAAWWACAGAACIAALCLAPASVPTSWRGKIPFRRRDS
ncbi:MAG: MFS transporter [Nocardioidaceae bacterium]